MPKRAKPAKAGPPGPADLPEGVTVVAGGERGPVVGAITEHLQSLLAESGGAPRLLVAMYVLVAQQSDGLVSCAVSGVSAGDLEDMRRLAEPPDVLQPIADSLSEAVRAKLGAHELEIEDRSWLREVGRPRGRA